MKAKQTECDKLVFPNLCNTRDGYMHMGDPLMVLVTASVYSEAKFAAKELIPIEDIADRNPFILKDNTVIQIANENYIEAYRPDQIIIYGNISAQAMNMARYVLSYSCVPEEYQIQQIREEIYMANFEDFALNVNRDIPHPLDLQRLLKYLYETCINEHRIPFNTYQFKLFLINKYDWSEAQVQNYIKQYESYVDAIMYCAEKKQ